MLWDMLTTSPRTSSENSPAATSKQEHEEGMIRKWSEEKRCGQVVTKQAEWIQEPDLTSAEDKQTTH